MADAAKDSQAIEVRAGETTVLEIVATPKNGATNDGAWGAGSPGSSADSVGSLEVQMLDEQGNPVTVGPLYLLAKNGSVVEMKIDAQGRGTAELPVGDYELTLQKPSARARTNERRLGQLFFSVVGQTTLPADAMVTIRKVLDDAEATQREASDKGIYRMTAHGYADNIPGSNEDLARAKAAKDALEQERVLRKLAWLETAMEPAGQLPGDSEAERQANRRVDFVLRPPTS